VGPQGAAGSCPCPPAQPLLVPCSPAPCFRTSHPSPNTLPACPCGPQAVLSFLNELVARSDIRAELAAPGEQGCSVCAWGGGVPQSGARFGSLMMRLHFHCAPPWLA
jgi:hypothetical protein